MGYKEGEREREGECNAAREKKKIAHYREGLREPEKRRKRQSEDPKPMNNSSRKEILMRNK